MSKNTKPNQSQTDEIVRTLGVDDSTWAEIGGEIIKLVDESNKAYGDSTEKSAAILQILWPDGVPVDRMHDFRCMVSILDKLSRIATDKDAFGECAFRDIAGYALLGYRHDLKTHQNRER